MARTDPAGGAAQGEKQPGERARQLIEWAVRGMRPAGAVLLIVIIASILGVIAWVTNGTPKDMVAVATAIAGLATVTIGLLLARDAGELLYDREAARRGGPSALSSVTQQLVDKSSGTTGKDLTKLNDEQAKHFLSLTTLNLNELLPKLITTAAGLAVALVLLGMLMLLGAAATIPATSPSPSPTASAAASPTPCVETTPSMRSPAAACQSPSP